jgi:hypothetical protein
MGAADGVEPALRGRDSGAGQLCVRGKNEKKRNPDREKGKTPMAVYDSHNDGYSLSMIRCLLFQFCGNGKPV